MGKKRKKTKKTKKKKAKKPKKPKKKKAGKKNKCNWGCYLQKYPDLRKAFGTNQAKAKEHWFNHGRKEKRCCTCRCNKASPPLATGGATGYGCNWICYLQRYPDLRKAFGTNQAKAKEHWINHGRKEKRCCTCRCGNMVGSSTAHYPDLQKFYWDAPDWVWQGAWLAKNQAVANAESLKAVQQMCAERYRLSAQALLKRDRLALIQTTSRNRRHRNKNSRRGKHRIQSLGVHHNDDLNYQTLDHIDRIHNVKTSQSESTGELGEGVGIGRDKPSSVVEPSERGFIGRRIDDWNALKGYIRRNPFTALNRKSKGKGVGAVVKKGEYEYETPCIAPGPNYCCKNFVRFQCGIHAPQGTGGFGGKVGPGTRWPGWSKIIGVPPRPGPDKTKKVYRGSFAKVTAQSPYRSVPIPFRMNENNQIEFAVGTNSAGAKACEYDPKDWKETGGKTKVCSTMEMGAGFNLQGNMNNMGKKLTMDGTDILCNMARSALMRCSTGGNRGAQAPWIAKSQHHNDKLNWHPLDYASIDAQRMLNLEGKLNEALNVMPGFGMQDAGVVPVPDQTYNPI